MELHLKHKVLITVSIALTLLFAVLFLFAVSQLKTLKTKEVERNQYLRDEEAVIIKQNGTSTSEQNTTTTKEVVLPIEPVLFEYIEVVDGCEYDYSGDCLNVRSGPGLEFPVVSRLRNGIVLKIDGQIIRDDTTWYKVVFDEWIRYPERIKDDWYVAAPYVQVLLDEGPKNLDNNNSTPHGAQAKQIVVDRSEQTLYAYEDDELFMQISISTGVELTPTPRGTFTIFRKTPSRYMQGPLPGISSRYWDLPGVPWNLYFTHQGAVIHGTYWHNDFGSRSSNGCVNVRPDEAKKLYNWATIGTQVVVRD